MQKPNEYSQYIILIAFRKLEVNLISVCACDQCFCQTAPLRESGVAIREGPQKSEKRANLVLYFYKAAGLTQP